MKLLLSYWGRWSRSLARLITPAALIAILAVDEASAASPICVVTTTSILMDLTREVGGEDVNVSALVPPNGDAHVYEPKPSDVQAIASADLMVDNGLGLESWLAKLVAAADYRGKVVRATAGIQPLAMREGNRNVDDPHAWQDLANGQIYVRNIADALIAADAAHADRYRRRAASYEARLAALDQEIRTKIAQIPRIQRQVITSHDAFQYYGKAYGITFIAPLGLSTDEGEPSAANLGQLEAQIRTVRIRALFIENMTDRRLIDQLAADTGAVVGPSLYSDALSPPTGPAATYFEMFVYNTNRLVAGMRLNAP